MNDVSLHQFLVLYTWFPLAALLLFMLLIARIYQKFSGIRMYFWLYVIAGILFGAMSVRYASAGIVLGDVVSDVLSIAGGIILLILVTRLYIEMILRKGKP